jgi:hypothetical protein
MIATPSAQTRVVEISRRTARTTPESLPWDAVGWTTSEPDFELVYFHRKWTKIRPKFFESFSTR